MQALNKKVLLLPRHFTNPSQVFDEEQAATSKASFWVSLFPTPSKERLSLQGDLMTHSQSFPAGKDPL